MKAQRLAEAVDEYTFGKTGEALSTALDECVRYIHIRGFDRLLPQILTSLSETYARDVRGTRLTLTEKTDVLHVLKSLDLNAENVSVERNENIIGGYLLETDTTFIDNSYRRQLLKLYKSIAH